MEHDYYKSCKSNDCGGGCMFCTLGICKVCALIEGCLTTECPGVDAFKDHGDAVYEGKEDFRGGAWVPLCSPYSPAFYRDKTTSGTLMGTDAGEKGEIIPSYVIEV